MKKLLVTFMMASMLFAFGGVAGADTIIYEDTYKILGYDDYYGTPNYEWSGSGYYDHDWAPVTGLWIRTADFGKYWEAHNMVDPYYPSAFPSGPYLSSKAKFELLAGNTYKMSASVYYDARIEDEQYFSLSWWDENSKRKTVNVELENAIYGELTANSFQRVEFFITPDADTTTALQLFSPRSVHYDDLMQEYYLTSTSWFYIKDIKFELLGGGNPAVPIPGAIFLLAPGLAGLGYLRKRMS